MISPQSYISNSKNPRDPTISGKIGKSSRIRDHRGPRITVYKGGACANATLRHNHWRPRCGEESAKNSLFRSFAVETSASKLTHAGQYSGADSMPTATTKRPHRRGKTDTVNGRQGRRGGAPDSARKARRSESVKRRRTVAAQPYFDVELRELWLGDVLVKRLDARATNQILMLTSFQ